LIRLTNNALSVEVTAFGIRLEPPSDNSRIVAGLYPCPSPKCHTALMPLKSATTKKVNLEPLTSRFGVQQCYIRMENRWMEFSIGTGTRRRTSRASAMSHSQSTILTPSSLACEPAARSGARWRGGALRRQLSALLRPRPGGDHRRAGGADRLRAWPSQLPVTP
jgi:hypothetical protein